MKPKNDIRQILGLTQLEIAMELNVSRSQWAMFESGKRTLPLHATQRLAELLAHQNQKTQRPAAKRNQEVVAEIVKKLLHENQYQQLLTGKKIAALQRKQAKAERLAHLSGYLQKESKGQPHALSGKATQLAHQDFDHELTTLELRREWLLAEEKFLLSKLPTDPKPKR